MSTDKIIALLKENHLPVNDILSSPVEFITSESEENFMGCIGLENCGVDGLVRSFVVSESFKNKGIGKWLLNELIEKSKADGIKKLHLLTTTAERYFSKNGFQVCERFAAPELISKTKEFSEICPSSSVYMVREI